MAKLSELSAQPNLKLLIYGDSGHGKTCTAASFPTPIEIHDFDGKANSAAFFFRNSPERLNAIDVRQYNKFPKEVRIAEWDKRIKEIAHLANTGKPLPFKTLVIDSLTTLTQSILDDYIHRSQKALKRALPDVNCMQDYQLLDRHMSQLIGALLSLDCNVVWIGHVATEKDELTGQIFKKPMMPGKFADKLPMYFEEVYVAKIDAGGKYVLQTQSDYYYKCRTQRGLAKEVPATYESLILK